MTVSTISGYRIPQWDIYDRMTKSLKECGMSVQEVADYYDVHRYASRGYAATRDLRAVQEALGHASVATTQRYTAVTRSEVRAVSEAAA